MIADTIQRTVDLDYPRALVQVLVVIEAGDLGTIAVVEEKLAELRARGPGGERTIPAGEFFRGLFTSALAPNEVLTEVRVPRTAGRGWSYLKFHRRAQDWAVVGVAAVVERSNGSIGSARIGLTNMCPTPLRARSAESALSGADPSSVADATRSADEGTSPSSDIAASSEYRRHLARGLSRRAVEEALSR